MLSNKGKQAYGRSEEDRVATILQSLAGVHIFRNVYIPSGYGRTTEMDLVLLSAKGLFLFEVKGYGGTITGSVPRYDWTQVYRQEGKLYKRKFYNPVKQQTAHMGALMRWLGLPASVCHGYIVFSERAKLKKVPGNAKTYTVLQTPTLYNAIKQRLINSPVVFDPARLQQIEAALRQSVQPTKRLQQRHIEDARKAENDRKARQGQRQQERKLAREKQIP